MNLPAHDASPHTSRTRRLLGDASALTLGSVVNGIAAYAFVALGTRTYGAAEFAPVSVLWTFWALSTAVLTFPLQHWIIRTVEAEGAERSVRSELPQVVVITLAVSATLAGAAALWRSRLFGSDAWLWPSLVLAVGAGSAVLGYLRGVLAARRRFAATGTAIAAENLARLAGAIVVVLAGAWVGWFGAALTLGPLVILLWPDAWRLRTAGTAHRHRLVEFFGGLGGGVLLAQVALNAGPAVLAGLGGAPASVTALFAAIALFRAPYLIAIGVASRATGPLTARVVAGDDSWLGSLRTGVGAFGAASAMVAAGLGLLIGPELIEAIFGGGVAPGRGVVALVAAGSALALAGLIGILLLVARGGTASIVGAWTAGLAAGAVVIALAPFELLTSVAAGFLVSEVVAVAGLLTADRRLATTAPAAARPVRLPPNAGR